MSVRPLPVRPLPRRAGHQLVSAAAARVRKPPSPGGLARRRIVINLTKWLLPTAALMLLATIAVWPEVTRLHDSARIAYHRISGEISGATVTDAQYRGVDENGRPYTVTAKTAHQTSEDRINLTTLKADMVLGDGTWLMLQSKQGVYLQSTSQLDRRTT